MISSAEVLCQHLWFQDTSKQICCQTAAVYFLFTFRGLGSSRAVAAHIHQSSGQTEHAGVGQYKPD